MRQTTASQPGVSNQAARHERGNSRLPALALGFFLLGIAASAIWFYRASHHRSATATGSSEGVGTGPLSEGTLAVLKRLGSPVELRFYSLLDPATTSDSLRSFSGRVEQLLSLYQQAAKGQLKVTRFTSLADSSQAAVGDGLRAFNADKGDACFLGIALVGTGHKEALAQLSPDWESALESDLSRALARLIDASAPARPAATPRVDAATIDEVKRKMPNLETVSLEDGAQLLRDAAVSDMKATLADTDAKIKEAEQRLTQAQTGGSDADKQAALKNLQQAQAAQTEKLKQIADRTAAQVEALKKLKSEAK